MESELQITVDANKINSVKSSTDTKLPSNSEIFCHCQTELCTCDSLLSVTEASAKRIYSHLGYPSGRDAILLEGYRLNTLHIWGTQDLSTTELLNWLKDFDPRQIEWIDDFSCNVVLVDENSALRAITKLAEPFDRRTTVAAITAVAAVVAEKASFDSCGDICCLPDVTLSPFSSHQSEPFEMFGSDDKASLTTSRSMGSLTTISQLTRHMPTTGRWFKALDTPERAFCLYLRFANKGDVKLPGAERRSDYYKRYGNPNYGGVIGLLSNSYRHRTKTAHRNSRYQDLWTGDSRCVNSRVRASTSPQIGDKPNKSVVREPGARKLVTYSDLYDDNLVDDTDELDELVKDFDEGLISVQNSLSQPKSKVNFITKKRRRGDDVLDFPPNMPRKWPRNDSFSLQVRPVTKKSGISPVFDQPVVRSKNAPNLISRSGATGTNRVSAKERLGSRPSYPPTQTLATITLLPDTAETSDTLSRTGSRRLLASLSMVADLEEQNMISQRENGCNSFAGKKWKNKFPSHIRNVWSRLG